jgi:predicted nucleic acid-binding protein
VSIYLDTSALAKLVVTEGESSALRARLRGHGAELISNSIGAVELQRLAARVSREASSAAVLLLTRIDLLSLTPGALSAAAQLPPPEVRTLDALHIASAAELSDLEALVTYDHRMQTAARHYGLPVENPGG